MFKARFSRAILLVIIIKLFLWNRRPTFYYCQGSNRYIYIYKRLVLKKKKKKNHETTITTNVKKKSRLPYTVIYAPNELHIIYYINRVSTAITVHIIYVIVRGRLSLYFPASTIQNRNRRRCQNNICILFFFKNVIANFPFFFEKIPELFFRFLPPT